VRSISKASKAHIVKAMRQCGLNIDGNENNMIISHWTTATPFPHRILDATGAVWEGTLYVCGGKVSDREHVSTFFAFDPELNRWTRLPDRPGPAVENPGLVSFEGQIIAIGGSTKPFSGCTSDVHAYNISTSSWSPLPSIQLARGGASAQVYKEKIYIIGGMDDNGNSLASVEVFDPHERTWNFAPEMSIPRDNPGSAVLGGEMYVFGGRVRTRKEKDIEPTLRAAEAYDVETGAWRARAPMPTGRRTMVVGTLGGKAQLIRGEKTPTKGSFEANEEYDPQRDQWRALTPMLTPRHGAAGGTIKGKVYTVGGGPRGGSAFSSVTEVFQYY